MGNRLELNHIKFTDEVSINPILGLDQTSGAKRERLPRVTYAELSIGGCPGRTWHLLQQAMNSDAATDYVKNMHIF